MPEQPTLRERIEHIVKVAIEGIRENTLRDPSDDAMHWLEDTVFDIMNALEPARQASTDVGLREAVIQLNAELDAMWNDPERRTIDEYYVQLITNAQQACYQALAGGTDGWREDALKWRKLMACQRIRVMGWTHDMKHIGMEFWSVHRSAHPSEEFPQEPCRAKFEEFVEALPSPPQRGRE